MTCFAMDLPGSIPFDKIIAYANPDADMVGQASKP
jgi:hypothetical protein